MKLYELGPIARLHLPNAFCQLLIARLHLPMPVPRAEPGHMPLTMC